MINLYLFDVDETLECSPITGPVKLSQLRNLHDQGHIVGLCGNFAAVTLNVPDWHRFISIIGSFGLSKGAFMTQVKTYIKADRYIMVGNVAPIQPFAYPDHIEAAIAGFEFIAERKFKEGL